MPSFLADLPPSLTDCTPRARGHDHAERAPSSYSQECIGREAERRIRAMDAEDMHDELLWLLDSKPRPKSQIELLEEMVRVVVIAYMDASEWQRSTRVMLAIKPVYEALHAEVCREIEGESDEE